MAGSSRILTKLQDAIQTHKYYEAHQLVKTLNFRYTSGKRYDELETLLENVSEFLLDNKQFESGMDVAIMIANLYKAAEFKPNTKRIDASVRLLKKMPNSPERGQFILGVADWVGVSEISQELNSSAAEIYIQERGFEDAWKHIIRLYDGKQAATYVMQIIQGLGAFLRQEELGLLTAHLVITFLVAKKIPQAEQAFVTMVQSQDVNHLYPLLNGTRFLVESAKMNDPEAFQSIQHLYDLSFSRDPNLKKLVCAAGKSLFHLNDERANPRGGGGFMSILNAMMNTSTP